MSSEEILQELTHWIDTSQTYLRSNKKSFRIRSSVVKILSMGLSAAATIILGLQNLTFWPGLAFAFVSLVTVLNSVEPFFAWRSRWVLMEEAQYKLHRLKDEIAFVLASTREGEMTSPDVQKIYSRYQEVWDQLSLQWLEYRKHDRSGG